MAEYSAKDIAALRKATGAPMMDCKNALEESEGDKGPQASTVQIVNKPGIRLPAAGPASVVPARGWEDTGFRRGRRRAKRGPGL